MVVPQVDPYYRPIHAVVNNISISLAAAAARSEVEMVKKLLLILTVVSSAQVLAQPPESAPQTVLAVGTAAPQQSAVEPRQPRLRFKSSGPTCMC